MAKERQERQEFVTKDIKIYPSTHQLIAELRVKLYRKWSRSVNQAEAVDYAIKRVLEELERPDGEG